MTIKRIIIFVLWLSFLLVGHSSFSQKKQEIHWISFSQLNDSLKLKPKKVFINFYADWCTFCKEMEKGTFTNQEVIKDLNESYYAVKMNVESKDTVIFGNQTFVNKRFQRVNPIHEIALLMASRKDKIFSLPSFIVLDEKFTATARYFQFLDVDAMVKVLSR